MYVQNRFLQENLKGRIAMTSSKSQKNRGYYIHCIVFIILTFAIGFLPPFGQITPLGMKVLGCFIGVIYGWIFVGFIWPSLFGMIALGIVGYDSFVNVFGAALGNSTVIQTFFTFIFVATLDASGFTKFIAEWCVSRKICKGRPWVLTALFFLASFFVAGCINLYGGIIILWSIFYNICKLVGFKKGEPYVSYMVAGIVFVGTISIVSMPFLPLSIIYYGLLGEAAVGYAMPSLALTIDGLLIVIVSTLLYLLVGKYVLKINVEPLKNAESFLSEFRNVKITHEQVLSIISLIFFMVIALLPSFLPDSNVKAFLSNYGILGAATTVIIIQCLRRDKDGKSIYNFGDLVQRGVNWDIVIMFAASMPMSASLESNDTGIVATLVDVLMPFLSQLSPAFFIIACCIIFWLVTQVAHNLILVIVFMPILATIGTSFGINPYLFAILFCMTTNCAFMTPGASAQAAMLFGNSNWIGVKDSYKLCTIFAILAIIAIICVGLPVGLLIV